MKRILLVDDEPDLVESLAMALEGQFEVRTAHNGQEALAVLAREPIDAIVLDLMMPVMDGWTFRAEQMRDPQLAQIPVVVISAVRDVGKQVKDLGLIGYLKKPIDLKQLLNIVSEHCCTGAQNTTT